MEYTVLYKDFKKKAVTLSFDDGTFYDVLFVEFLNKYGLKCTFNLNSALFGAIANLNFRNKIIFHNRISEEQTSILYKGHEIASHSLHHPLLTNASKELLDKEILEDAVNLSRISGEKVVGFAIPGGPHDAFLDNYLKDKFLYARTVDNTYSYDLPETFVPLNPSIFILDEKFEKFCSDYTGYKSENMSLLYIWGHSYEFAIEGVAETFKKVCMTLLSDKDIYFGTNKDVITYIRDSRLLKFDGKQFINPSDSEIYLDYKGKRMIIRAKSSTRA